MRKSFKKALSLVLALTLIMSMVCISNFAVSAESTQYKLGDANTDGNVDVRDATTIQQIAAMLVTPTDQQRYLADVTGNGEIDIRDATLIQQYIAMVLGDAPTNADGYKIGDLVTFGENPTSPSTSPSTEPQPTSESQETQPTSESSEEPQPTSESQETQPTSESSEEPQPTSESSEETQPSSSEEQTSKYGLHMSDGNGSNWKTNPMTVNGDVATVEMQLTAGTYKFKITDGDKWYGNNGTIKDTTTTTSKGGWVMETSAGNCKLEATGGTYTFAYTISTSKLIVTFVPAETQATSESETQPTSESSEETQPTTEASEETQASTETVATKTYTFYFAPLASDVEAGYKFIANVQSDADVENAWFPYEMTATGTTFNGAAVYAAEITVLESQNMLSLQFQVYDDTNWKHQILVVNSTVTPYSAYDGKIVVATAKDKGEVKDYVADEESQPTSESEPQPTSESETQPSSSEEQTSKYGLHMSDGNGSNWKTNPMTVNGDVATVEMQLTAGTYKFKITDGDKWYGNNGTIKDTTTTTSKGGWVMETSAGDCKLEATGGTYTFAYTISTSKLIVTFVPAETQATSESEPQPTSESSEATQPTTEASEETQPSSSEEQTSKYGLHMSDGNGSNWKTNPMTVNGDVATVEMQLTAGTYKFKITDGDKWYGNNGTIADTTTTTSQHGWVMETSAGDCKLEATGGTYTFAYTISTSKLIVTFVPAETQATSESETQPTSESSEATQPTTEASEETQPSSSEEQTTKYGLHMSDGNGSNWKTNPMTVNGDVATVEMQLTAGTYKFKITDGDKWYGNNGTIADTTTTTSQHGWVMETSAGNCKLEATGGTYTFAYTISTSKLIVTFVPAETQATTPSEETPTEPTPTEPDPEPVASAYKVAGSFNDWGNSTDVMYYTSDEVVTVTLDLTAGTYEFKITDGTNWYGNNGTIEDTTTITSTSGWDMSTNDNNCTLNATGGTYTFTFNLSTKKLIIVKEA